MEDNALGQESQSREHELHRILAINRHYDESPRTAVDKEVDKENGCGRYPEL